MSGFEVVCAVALWSLIAPVIVVRVWEWWSPDLDD